jgi:3-oxoacyl-(acyl-carrier-protein) synthase
MTLSGAMKSNFGHMEGASGIAAFIKTVMVLENGIVPPIANLEVLNPRIPAHLWNVDVSWSRLELLTLLTQPCYSSSERSSGCQKRV